MGLKKIPVSKLRLGMYIAGLDRSWFQSPFLRHRFLLDSESQLHRLKQHGIKTVVIDPSRGLDEDPDPSQLWKAPPPPLAEAHAMVHPPSKPPQVLARDLALAQRARRELVQSIHSVFETIGSSGTVKSDRVQGIVHDITTVTETLDNPAAFLALSRTKDFDPALKQHALSVSTLALILGRSLGLDRPTLGCLATGALLHDIGLIRMPNHFLRLSGTLGKHERTLFESHPRLGAISLEQSSGFHPDVLRIVAEHHVTLDGHGFPPETAPDGIADVSRLVMVVDRYDELVCGQGDLAPMSTHQALAKLYQEAQQQRLDLDFVSHFVRMVGVYPIYTPIQLDTGERGVVIAVNPDALHEPIVVLHQNAAGVPYAPPLIVDLHRQEHDAPSRAVAAALDADAEGINIAAWLERTHPGADHSSRTQAAPPERAPTQ